MVERLVVELNGIKLLKIIQNGLPNLDFCYIASN